VIDPLVSGNTQPDTPIPSQFTRYELLDKLGEGGMGVVFRARDPRLGRTVVLKFLPPHMSADEVAKKRFMIEAQAAAALEHPNICTIHEIGETPDGQLYIVMAYYEGETLGQRLARGPLPVRQAIVTALEIAKGLSRAHERGIVHRDIKPANVMITKDETVKILDFGIAKLGSNALTQTGGVIGTFAYMSPEQAFGEPIDARSDVWSLGVLMYEMITGANPFRRETDQAMMYAVLTADVEPLAATGNGVPREVDGFLSRALARQKSDRFQTAQEMADELASLLSVVSSATPAKLPLRSRSRGFDTDSSLTRAGERRHATVVVSQIDGYSQMVERSAPDDCDILTARIRETAAELASAQGGILNSFDGEELLALFGVPVAHEDDFVRASRFAVALHARVQTIATEMKQQLGVMLQLRSGIQTGLVVAQQLRAGERRYKVAGPPVAVSSRLAGLAGAGQVLISPEVQRLITPFFMTEALPPVTLHADSPPTHPFRITGQSGASSRLEAAEVSQLTPYTGRGRELSSLHEQLELARAGAGQLAIIIGEAGVGKSRLIMEFERAIRPDSVRILHGRCDAMRVSIAYLPFIRMLEHALGVTIESAGSQSVHDRAVAAIRSIGSTLDEYLPLLLHLLSMPSDEFPLPKHLQKEDFHTAMTEALTAVLTLQAQRSPTLLVLEDWHWADDASRQVLRQLSEITPGYELFVVVTARPEHDHEWGSGEHQRLVHLAPVDAGASLALLEAALGVQRVSEEIAREVLRRAGGNPFFIEEMCHSLVENGALQRTAGEAVVVDRARIVQLPDTVQAVVGTRIDRLEATARDVLKVASVIGPEFRRGILEQVAEQGVDLSSALERLKSAGLIQQAAVVPRPAYRFRHILTHEVAYNSLLEHQRSVLHAAVGRAIETDEPDRLDEQSDVLARHFSRAREWAPAIRYAMTAADRATRLSQFAQALSSLDDAHDWLFELAEDESRQELLAEILLRQERMCETLGLRERQQHLVARLIELLEPRGESEKLAEAYRRQGELYTLLRHFYLAAQALAKSLHIARSRKDAFAERNALRSLGFLRWNEGNFTQALSLAKEALDLDRSRGDQEAVEGDLINLGQIYKGTGDYERSLESLEAALRVSTERGDVVRQCYMLGVIGQVHHATGNLDKALEYLQRADDGARVQKLPIQRSFHLISLANVLVQLGETDKSLALYHETLDVCRRAGYTPGLAQSLRLLGDLLITLGRDGEAVQCLREAAGAFTQLADPETEGEIWTRCAPALERLGRWEEAFHAWESALRLPRRTGDLVAELNVVEGIARAARYAKHAPETVIERYEEAHTLCSSIGDDERCGALRNTLGILEFERGRYDAADGHYLAAASLFHDLDDRVHEGLMLNSRGVTLTRLSKYDEARAILGQARELNLRTGQRLLEAHSLSALGELAILEGDLQLAKAAYSSSLDIRREIRDRRGEAWSLLNLARVHSAIGSESDARKLREEARSLADELHDPALAAACAESANLDADNNHQGE